MTMTAAGIAKLLEECGELQKELGELVQVLSKKLAYFHTDEHPDGAGSLQLRIQDEMADVQASIDFVSQKLGLDPVALASRRARKLRLFESWDAPREADDLGFQKLPQKRRLA